MPLTRLQAPKPVITHQPIKKACVLGGGAFGTALSTIFARLPNAPAVAVFHPAPDETAMINKKHENVFYLPACPLPKNIVFTSDVSAAISDADIIAVAVPTQYLRGFLTSNLPILKAFFGEKPDVPILVGTKGIEERTLVFPTEIVAEVLRGLVRRKNIATLAGPNFASEIAKKKFSAATVAAEDITTARRIQAMMCTPDPRCTFRLYASTDVIGCEVASAVKNVVAIASGAMSGLGQQQNCRAALICRGMAELQGLVDKLGGRGYALQGLAGVGDMLLTCSSENSRNFSVGLRLGQGEPIEEIVENPRAVAEGVTTSKALKALAERVGHVMPICDAVYDVLYNNGEVKAQFERLMAAPLEDEVQCIGLSPTTPIGNALLTRRMEDFQRLRKEAGENGTTIDIAARRYLEVKKRRMTSKL